MGHQERGTSGKSQRVAGIESLRIFQCHHGAGMPKNSAGMSEEAVFNGRGSWQGRISRALIQGGNCVFSLSKDSSKPIRNIRIIYTQWMFLIGWNLLKLNTTEYNKYFADGLTVRLESQFFGVCSKSKYTPWDLELGQKFCTRTTFLDEGIITRKQPYPYM